MYIRRQIRNITAPQLFLALIALGSLGFVIGILILRWGPTNARSQESLTVRDILGEKDIVFGLKPGLEELAELGCGIIVEPTYVHCVQPNRSIPIIVRFPTIRALLFVRQALAHELRELPKLAKLERVSFISCEFDVDLAFLSDLPSLRYLGIRDSNLTNAQLQQILSDLGFLNQLDVGMSNVSSLDFLHSMPELEVLRLDATRITDEDIQSIRILEKLRVLEVGWTDISDTSVDVLLEIKGLQRLDIRRTRLTEDGVQRLKSAISDVYHDY